MVISVVMAAILRQMNDPQVHTPLAAQTVLCVFYASIMITFQVACVANARKCPVFDLPALFLLTEEAVAER